MKDIYIIEEQILNGTVTMGISQTGIEAESFQEAVEKFLKYLEDKGNKTVKIAQNSDEAFSYTVEQEEEFFTVCGRIKKEPLKILC